MPGNVAAAAPVDTFPTDLYASFSIQMRLESIVNSYPDGSSERAALATNPRRFFKLSFALRRPATGPPGPSTPTPESVANYTAMRNFYMAHEGKPFYFYDLLEALPGPPPGDPIGRYVVVFDGPWSEELQPGRTRITLALREVA